MARSRFDEQLVLLNTELLKMGSLIEAAIEGAAEALVEHDVQKARAIIQADEQVNRQEREIESLCLKLLLQQQPVARDLRTISAALKMITDMERIGDQAADISEIVTTISPTVPLERVQHLHPMAAATIKMVNGAIDAFVQRDIDRAYAVMEADDKVDALFIVVRDELISWIRSDDACGEEVADLLMVAKYFERIGDHAQNIAEWVEYSITGIHKGELLG